MNEMSQQELDATNGGSIGSVIGAIADAIGDFFNGFDSNSTGWDDLIGNAASAVGDWLGYP
jgi:hypothetical protein